jgi:hypothetical protein
MLYGHLRKDMTAIFAPVLLHPARSPFNEAVLYRVRRSTPGAWWPQLSLKNRDEFFQFLVRRIHEIII